MADDIKRTLLLNFKAETKSVVDLGVLFAKTEEQAKAMLVEQTKLLDESIKSSEKLAKAQAKEAKIIAATEAKEKKELARQELADLKERNRQATAEAKAQAKEAAQLAKEQAKQLVESTKEQVRQAKEQVKAVNDAVKEQNRLAKEEAKRSALEAKEQAKEQVRILKEQAQAAKDAAKTAAQEAKAQLTEENNTRKAAAAEQARLTREQREAEKQAAKDRIAQVRQEARELQAAQEAYNRSMIGRLSTTPRYTPQTSMISGMSEAGRTANASAATTVRQLPNIPPIPQETRSSYDSLFARIGAINIEYRLWNEAINTVTNSLRAIPKIGIELEATKSVLTAVMGSEVGMESVLKSLTKEADRTGMSLEAIRTSFRTFSASTTLAGESLDSTWKMFTNMNTVITALHLSTDQANHVFLALSQIFNKSKVQSEELVKQLGNLLPGAFASFQKANQDAFKSTMALSQAMKQGTVFAQETVEKFTNYMATRFANAFDTASQGLNANLNRMQTSFIELGEAIYGLAGGPLQAAVKGITDLTKYFTASVKGENDFIATTKLLADVLIGALAAGALVQVSAALDVMKVKIVELGGVAAASRVGVQALGASLLALSGPAIVTGLVTVIAYAKQLGSEQASLAARARKDIEDISAEKKKADMMEPIAIRVENDPNVRANIKNIEEYRTEYNKMVAAQKAGQSIYAGENGTEDITKAQARMLEAIKKNEDKLKDTKFKAQAQIEAADAEFLKNQITHGVDLTTEIQNAHVTALEAQGKYVEAAGQKFENQTKASFAAAEDQIRQQKARVEKLTKENKEGSFDTQIADAKAEIEKLENFKADLKADKEFKMQQAQERLDKKASASAKSAASERLKGIKEEIGQVQEYQRTAANDAKTQIDILNADNKAKILSFEEYARRKQEILDKDYNTEKKWYEDQKALAEKSGKKGLVTKADEELKRLEQDYQAKSATRQADTTKSMEDYETNLASIHQQYQDILGIERDSTEITKTKLELLNKQIEAEIKEGGEVGKTASLRKEELEILIEARNLKAKMAIYDKETATAEKIHSDAISRINQLENVGQMGSLSATMARTKANERLLEIRQKDVDLAKKAMDDAKPEARPAAQASYDLAVQRLQSLKLVANETGAMIEQSLGNAFEGAFNGLITKSMTARQAFASFTNSILADIAKIIAQEMRSQLLSAIIRPLAGAALSGLGNLAQSAGAIQFTNISSDPNMIGPMKPTFAANGGVFAGAGISAHSGTIVSSPTVFPFAKGVGLMGEAGPEAILPLKRNAQGKLGISAENTGHSNNNLYNITVNVESKQGENPEQFGQRAASAMMRSIAREEISNAKRPGNTLNKSRFG
jgi:lambda family phage tail tape measure protein